MASAADVIGRLDHWLAEYRPAYYARLRPGLSSGSVAALECDVGYRFPELFRAFYRWRNGQEDDLPGGEGFVGNQMFIGDRQIRKCWRMLTDMQEGGEWEQPQWWCRGWVPFLDGQGSSHLCLDMHGSFTGKRGQVVWFDGKSEGRAVAAPTFLAWLSRLVASLEAGRWTRHRERRQFEEVEKWPPIPGYPIRVSTWDKPMRRCRGARHA